MKILFEIEAVVNITNRGQFIFAKLLDTTQDFCLNDQLFLDDIEVCNELNMPRATNENGEPRLDVFAFQIMHKKNYDKLIKGSIVDLIIK